MRKIFALFAAVVLVFVTSCGGGSDEESTPDTSPAGAKVIALMGAYAAYATHVAAYQAGIDAAGEAYQESGALNGTDQAFNGDYQSYSGTEDDTIEGLMTWAYSGTEESWRWTVTSMTHSSTFANPYPENEAAITFDGTDYTAQAVTSDSHTLDGTGSGYANATVNEDVVVYTGGSVSGTSSVTDLQVTITSPAEESGTVSYTSQDLTGSVLAGGGMTQSSTMTSTVTLDGSTYTCTTETEFATEEETGVTLSVTSARCE